MKSVKIATHRTTKSPNTSKVAASRAKSSDSAKSIPKSSVDVKVDASEEPPFSGSWDAFNLNSSLVTAIKTHKLGKVWNN